MGRGLLVTGTDTGVGKTAVGCALLRALGARGIPRRAFKPIESGCAPGAPGEDAQALARAAGVDASAVAGLCLPDPLAPEEAARLSGIGIDPEAVVRAVEDRLGAPGICLVEGAGGLLVPIAPGFTFRELARRCHLPVLVVAANRLGVLNHTLLTAAALEAAGIPLLGVVLNEVLPPAADRARETNLGVLRRWLPGVPIGSLPWSPAGGDVAAEALLLDTLGLGAPER